MPTSLTNRFIDGLWRENPGLVQLLGLCPLLAVTGTFVNGLGLGVADLLGKRGHTALAQHPSSYDFFPALRIVQVA